MDKHAEEFYSEAMRYLNEAKIPFLLGGTYAITAYTGIKRPTKDLDIFCKAGDYPRILTLFQDKGYKVENTDERWLAKIFSKKHFVDIIFGTTTGLCQVDDIWIERATKASVMGVDVLIVPPEELIWSKVYRQEREKYDGADIHHMFLKKGHELDWKWLLNRMEQNWELLFAHVINFRFVYPADRHIIPDWFLTELIDRFQNQLQLTSPKDRVCRGRLISHTQYEYSIKEWDYKDVV